MISVVHSVALVGVSVIPVEVQTQIVKGLPAFTIVGMPDKAVNESRERVRSALFALGLALPAKRVTVNLSPADLPKDGAYYDLAIALGLLGSLEVLPAERLALFTAVGELALNGQLTRMNGILPVALHCLQRGRTLLCGRENGQEAAWAGEALNILAADSLLEAVQVIQGKRELARPKVANHEAEPLQLVDFKDVRGQADAKRALEIAAAGGHNLMMTGPPGAGKSLLAQAFQKLLPPLTSREALEVSTLHSLGGTLPASGLLTRRPFRDPHHSASMASIIGGGALAKPGEVSLAHAGVLFLDELPEFSRQVLDALRQPMETGQAVLARVRRHVTYPARFQCLAAMNPCRCGYLNDPVGRCSKAPRCGQDYQGRLSGPVLDRFDLRVEVKAVLASELTMGMGRGGASAQEDSSDVLAARVRLARERQAERYASPQQKTAEAFFETTAPLNCYADLEKLNQCVQLDTAGQKLMRDTIEKFHLSARGYHRILRVARTIADLAQSEFVSLVHLGEAISYRQMGGTGGTSGG